MPAPTVSMPSDLRVKNRKTILQIFYKNGLQSINDISVNTGISRQTIKKSVEYFLEQEYLVCAGKGQSSQIGGKRPELYDINPRMKVACISLHHHDVSVTILNFKYQIVTSWNSGRVKISSLEMLYTLLEEGREELSKQVQWQDVISLGFSGPLQIGENGKLLSATPFADWPKENIGQSFLEGLKSIFPNMESVRIISDGQAAGGAIVQQNEKYQEEKTVLTIYSDTGIGGSIYRNGRPPVNKSNLSEAIGHIVVDMSDQEACDCGVRGCLESMVNRKRKLKRFLEQKSAYRKSCLKEILPEEATFRQLFEGSSNGDSFCRQEVTYYAGVFARAIQNIFIVRDIDVIVFQGDFGFADKFFQSELLNSLKECKFLSSNSLPEILYDTKPLFSQEVLGMTYLLIQDYLDDPGKYL